MGDRSIFDSLYLSYDALEEQHKEMFLDVDCALVGTSMEKAKCSWKQKGGMWNLVHGTSWQSLSLM